MTQVVAQLRSGGRITGKALRHVTDGKKRAFLSAFARHAIVLDGLEAAGVCRKTTELWRNNDPEFRKRFEDAKEEGADRLERHAIALAMHAKKPNPIMTIFLLKGMRPLKYRDNVSVSGHDGGPLFRMVAGVSPQHVCGIESKPKLELAAEPKALLEDGKPKACESHRAHNG